MDLENDGIEKSSGAEGSEEEDDATSHSTAEQLYFAAEELVLGASAEKKDIRSRLNDARPPGAAPRNSMRTACE